MKKNNTAEKTILNAEKVTKALKEGTEKTLQALVNEAISNIILEGEDEDEVEAPSVEDIETKDDDSFEVEDVNVEDDSNVEDEVEKEEDSEENDDDEWSEFDEFKTDDNEFDFTGEEGVGEKLLKIFNKIDDDDELIVTKSDNQLTISNETDGTEEVIELELGSESDEMDEPEDSEDEVEFEVDTDEPEDDEDSDEELEIEFDEEDSDELDESTNLGYTDSYQRMTAMTTPPNKEVANPKDTYSMDDVPEGDGKRWAGKAGNSKPFGAKCCCENDEMMPEAETEIDEATNVGGAAQQRSTSKSHIPSGRKQYVPKGTRHASFGSDYTEVVESIKSENNALKESLKKVINNLREAATLNINLGRIVKLLSEETTTKNEKKDIIERFSKVKTINEGKTLYDSIKRELNENKKATVIIDNVAVAEKKNINETTIFNRSENPSLNLMDRMDNLWKQ